MSDSPTLDFVGYLYGIMVADGELLEILRSEADQTEIRMRYRKAQPDEKFPYVVHLLKLDDGGTPGIWSGEWIVDVWDYNPDAARVLKARDRIVAMYERRFYEEPPAGSGFSQPRIWLSSDDDLSDDSERIQRRSLRFGVRVIATATIQAVTGREEGA